MSNMWIDKLVQICLVFVTLLPFFLFAVLTIPLIQSLYCLTPFFNETIDETIA